MADQKPNEKLAAILKLAMAGKTAYVDMTSKNGPLRSRVLTVNRNGSSTGFDAIVQPTGWTVSVAVHWADIDKVSDSL